MGTGIICWRLNLRKAKLEALSWRGHVWENHPFRFHEFRTTELKRKICTLKTRHVRGVLYLVCAEKYFLQVFLGNADQNLLFKYMCSYVLSPMPCKYYKLCNQRGRNDSANLENISTKFPDNLNFVGTRSSRNMKSSWSWVFKSEWDSTLSSVVWIFSFSSTFREVWKNSCLEVCIWMCMGLLRSRIIQKIKTKQTQANRMPQIKCLQFPSHDLNLFREMSNWRFISCYVNFQSARGCRAAWAYRSHFILIRSRPFLISFLLSLKAF